MKISNHDIVQIERMTERLTNGVRSFAGAQDTVTLNQLQTLVAEVRQAMPGIPIVTGEAIYSKEGFAQALAARAARTPMRMRVHSRRRVGHRGGEAEVLLDKQDGEAAVDLVPRGLPALDRTGQVLAKPAVEVVVVVAHVKAGLGKKVGKILFEVLVDPRETGSRFGFSRRFAILH